VLGSSADDRTGEGPNRSKALVFNEKGQTKVTRTSLDEPDGTSRDQEVVGEICSSFPGRDRLIESTYRAEWTFRELCQDFQECAAAVERWREMPSAESEGRFEEYSELLTELSKEIEAWLEGIESSSSLVNKREP
jgi:hypothetical protein